MKKFIRSVSCEKELNKKRKVTDIPETEVGYFEVRTMSPQKLKEGKGTLFVYFQGVEIKYGFEDRTGNTTISWLEETIFPSEKKEKSLSNKLEISHVVKKVGFEHFITFNFPDVLTARGFDLCFDNLLSFLKSRDYVVVVSSFSTGATLMSEWILDAIKRADKRSLELLSKKVERVIMGGGLFEPKDLERKAYYAGKTIAKIPNTALKYLPHANINSFVKRGGGIVELIYRVKYLVNINNTHVYKLTSKNDWSVVKDIFEKRPDFKLVFLADTGQRIVMQTGAEKWYRNLHKYLKDNVQGYIAGDLDKKWSEFPSAKHEEVKTLWTLVSLVGMSEKLREKLNYSLLTSHIADEWPKYRFTKM